MQRAYSLEKTLVLGKVEGRRRRGLMMVGWHQQLSGHGFEQTPRDSAKRGSLECCSPWGHKESDRNERLNKIMQVNLLISRSVTLITSAKSLLSYNVACMVLGTIGWVSLGEVHYFAYHAVLLLLSRFSRVQLCATP